MTFELYKTKNVTQIRDIILDKSDFAVDLLRKYCTNKGIYPYSHGVAITVGANSDIDIPLTFGNEVIFCITGFRASLTGTLDGLTTQLNLEYEGLSVSLGDETYVPLNLITGSTTYTAPFLLPYPLVVQNGNTIFLRIRNTSSNTGTLYFQFSGVAINRFQVFHNPTQSFSIGGTIARPCFIPKVFSVSANSKRRFYYTNSLHNDVYITRWQGSVVDSSLVAASVNINAAIISSGRVVTNNEILSTNLYGIGVITRDVMPTLLGMAQMIAIDVDNTNAFSVTGYTTLAGILIK